MSGSKLKPGGWISGSIALGKIAAVAATRTWMRPSRTSRLAGRRVPTASTADSPPYRSRAVPVPSTNTMRPSCGRRCRRREPPPPSSSTSGWLGRAVPAGAASTFQPCSTPRASFVNHSTMSEPGRWISTRSPRSSATPAGTSASAPSRPARRRGSSSRTSAAPRLRDSTSTPRPATRARKSAARLGAEKAPRSAGLKRYSLAAIDFAAASSHSGVTPAGSFGAGPSARAGEVRARSAANARVSCNFMRRNVGRRARALCYLCVISGPCLRGQRRSVREGAVAAGALREAGRSLAGLAGADHLQAELRLEPQRILQAELPLAIRGQAVAAQAALWERGEIVRELLRFLERATLRHDPVRETHHARLVAGDAAAGEDQVERVRVADQAGEPDGAAVDQRHAPAAAEHAEDGVLGGDAQVAPERELEPARDGVPLHRGDHRLREEHARR